MSRRFVDAPSRAAALVSVLAVVSYLIVGHAAHAETTSMGAMHDPGICLLLATVVGGTLLLNRRLRGPTPSPATLRLTWWIAARAAPVPPQPRVSARASPVWLQRFLR